MCGMGESDVSPGTRFGNYILGDRLATGGMAEVFYAQTIERHWDRPIVLKRMHERLASNRGFVEMFIDEARITTRLEHPNIVKVYDFEATERGLYLVMELVDGPDLLAVIKRCAKLRTPIPPELAAFISCHVLEALDYAHSAKAGNRHLNVVHRDVSPSNILLTRRGHVKLADFGIARAAERQQEAQTGTLKGKFGYMSPEQVQGDKLDGRSDVFSMGIVLSEMLIARRLFSAPGEVERLMMVRRGDLTRLEKYGDHVPPELVDIIRKSLQVTPDDRFDTAGDFRDALTDWLASSNRRSGAQRLADYIKALESATGDLTVFRRPSSAAPTSSPTLSGTETRVAHEAIKKAVREGRKIFATADSFDNPDTLVQSLVLEPYDGGDTEVTARESNIVDLEAGDFTNVLPIKVVLDIGGQGLSGILKMEDGEAVREVYFRNGAPEVVRTNSRDERLGQYLLRRDLMTKDQLKRALAALPHFDNNLGQALVSLRLLKPVDAVRILQDHMLYKLIQSCGWRRGTFRFHEGENPWPEQAQNTTVRQLINRGLSSIPRPALAEWAKQHRSELVVFEPNDLNAFDLDADLRRQLLRLSGGKRGLWSVAKHVPTPLGRGRLIAATYILSSCGVIQFTDKRTAE